jgi:hypothetical protein
MDYLQNSVTYFCTQFFILYIFIVLNLPHITSAVRIVTTIIMNIHEWLKYKYNLF